ncbi:fungal-specific transcription factor domain-containing protein [Penicillium chermesinum]|uniref:Fungal-specific transcription factor domain-containing protein n=1 Tax=Penicillium chermesinum TaxID=63820 RepID=A0A9W9TFK9_9EURO|nr:fungal-specific transcription factor domain-containing protein [Penicillium chermesinum]KAJ5220564.1 fungal-specific transcription factor domain-containing protein [Penicillium chermesinum]KAJ6157990.1 fungal-specific transcription factor domain-containing protein [Penicillium chermesinum]
MSSPNQTPRARRHRSAVACQACRKRKVRCSLTVTGIPCAGCAQDATECIVNPRQAKGTKQNDRLGPRCRRQVHAETANSNLATGAYQARQIPHPSNEPTSAGLPALNPRVENTRRILDRDPSENEVNNMAEEERSGLDIASAALGQPNSVGEVPYYTGEQTGPTSALDICSPNHLLPKHFLIPLHRTHLSDEDQDFLQRKGVFTLPGKNACDAMVQAYLVHVHPILPIIEADVLVSHHRIGQLQNYNLLLLWSLFFVAVNFIPAAIYEQEGYTSRRAMKYTMYCRANCMFNNGGERNKVVLLQSSLLMGFWHSDMDEHAQPWYWSGIAISLCQILGLHRNPDMSNLTTHISGRQVSFWRRLWWCCLFRDRWLGLTLGRPLRINLDDCDTPMPVLEDLLFDIQKPEGSAAASYFPADMERLARYWIMLIELSCLLGDILTMNRRLGGLKASQAQVEGLEKRLLGSKLPDRYEVGLTPIASFYSNHVHLHYQAMAVTFYRPWGTEAPGDLRSTAKESWQHGMRLRADAAASKTNEILDVLVQEKLLGFAGPMTPPLLVPAMQLHLLQCKIGDTLTKRIRLNKLEMCMLVLEEFQKTYTVASLYRGIFTKAIQQIFPDYSPPIISSDYSAIPVAALATKNDTTGVHMEEESLDTNNNRNDHLGAFGFAATDDTDFLHVLLDDSSIFDVWQTWNQI